VPAVGFHLGSASVSAKFVYALAVSSWYRSMRRSDGQGRPLALLLNDHSTPLPAL
jgi:hypothetical protein